MAYSRSTLLLATLFAMCFSLQGCASLVAGFSDELVDQDHRYRTTGACIEDNAIERKALINLARSNPGEDANRHVVVSWNGQVLLAGQAQSAEMKANSEKIVREIRRVIHVHNELMVGPPVSGITRLADSWITFRLKARLLLASGLPGKRVKITTENGVIYLMGLLTQAEADAVVDAARKTRGAQQVVKIFEYIRDDGGNSKG